MKRTIGDALDRLINESLSGGLHQARLTEKEKQDSLDLDLDLGDDEGGDDSGGDMKGDDNGSSEKLSVVAREQENMKRVPDLDEIIEKLNIIRAGRSLKDEDVHQEFEQYYNQLDDPEKIALFVYLKGLGSIVTGGEEGEDAVDPGDKGVPVDIEADKPKVKSIKPNVIKEPAPPESSTKKSSSHEEDTTPPVPIKPVKKH